MASTVPAREGEFWLSIIVFRRDPFRGVAPSGSQSLPPTLRTVVDASLAETRRRCEQNLSIIQDPNHNGDVSKERSAYLQLGTGVVAVQHVMRAVLNTFRSSPVHERPAVLAALGARTGDRPDPVLLGILPGQDQNSGRHDVFLLRLQPDHVSEAASAGDPDGLPRPFRALLDIFVDVRTSSSQAGPGCYMYDGRHAVDMRAMSHRPLVRRQQPCPRLGRAIDALTASVSEMTSAHLRDASETEAALAGDRGPLIDYSPFSAALDDARGVASQAPDYSEWLQREEDEAAGVNDLMVFHSDREDGGQHQ